MKNFTKPSECQQFASCWPVHTMWFTYWFGSSHSNMLRMWLQHDSWACNIFSTTCERITMASAARPGRILNRDLMKSSSDGSKTLRKNRQNRLSEVENISCIVLNPRARRQRMLQKLFLLYCSVHFNEIFRNTRASLVTKAWSDAVLKSTGRLEKFFHSQAKLTRTPRQAVSCFVVNAVSNDVRYGSSLVTPCANVDMNSC